MLIDRYLPVFQFHEEHAITVAAAPGPVLEATLAYSPFADDPVVRAAIALRELPRKLLERMIPTRRPRPDQELSLDSFTRLDVIDGEEAVLGLAGRFWQLGYGLAPITDGTTFLAYEAPGAARLVINYAVRALPEGSTRLSTQTRVMCHDAAARRRFTPYWYLIRPVSGLLRRRMLKAIKRIAEKPRMA